MEKSYIGLRVRNKDRSCFSIAFVALILTSILRHLMVKMQNKVARAANSGRSTDNVRSKIGFVRSNPWMAGQFVQSFTLVRKKFSVQYYYYWCLSGQKWDMSEEKLVWPDNLTGVSREIICNPGQHHDPVSIQISFFSWILIDLSFWPVFKSQVIVGLIFRL